MQRKKQTPTDSNSAEAMHGFYWVEDTRKRHENRFARDMCESKINYCGDSFVRESYTQGGFLMWNPYEPNHDVDNPRKLEHPQASCFVNVDDNKNQVATVSGKEVRIWNASSKDPVKKIPLFKNNLSVNRVQMLSDKTHLVGMAGPGLVWSINLETANFVFKLFHFFNLVALPNVSNCFAAISEKTIEILSIQETKKEAKSEAKECFIPVRSIPCQSKNTGNLLISPCGQYWVISQHLQKGESIKPVYALYQVDNSYQKFTHLMNLGGDIQDMAWFSNYLICLARPEHGPSSYVPYAITPKTLECYTPELMWEYYKPHFVGNKKIVLRFEHRIFFPIEEYTYLDEQYKFQLDVAPQIPDPVKNIIVGYLSFDWGNKKLSFWNKVFEPKVPDYLSKEIQIKVRKFLCEQYFLQLEREKDNKPLFELSMKIISALYQLKNPSQETIKNCLKQFPDNEGFESLNLLLNEIVESMRPQQKKLI